jgi:hypothetical protein
MILSPSGDHFGEAANLSAEEFKIRLRPSSGTRKTGRFADRLRGSRERNSSGAHIRSGLKASPQFLSGNRIGCVMKPGRRMGLAFTTGDQGANGEIRNASWSPDGKRVVYQKWFLESWRQNQLVQYRVDRVWRRFLLSPSRQGGPRYDDAPGWFGTPCANQDFAKQRVSELVPGSYFAFGARGSMVSEPSISTMDPQQR